MKNKKYAGKLTRDGEEIDLELVVLGDILYAMGGHVSAERMTEFATALWYVQHSRVPKPQRGEELDRWFEYYYKKQLMGLKITLAEIAEEAGYSEGYVRQKKKEYDAEHEDPKT